MNLTDNTPLSKRYQKPAKKRGFGGWARRVSIVSVLLIVVTAGLLFGKGYLKLHKVFKGGSTAVALQAHVEPALLKGEGAGRINILLFGKGGAGHDGPDLTDTLLVMSVDPVNATASLVSVPRDLWVVAPNGGSSKINAVYANTKYATLAKLPKDKQGAESAGIAAAEKTVGQILGLSIHYYGMVDFTAFKQAIDTVGGVSVAVPEDLLDPTMAWENNRSAVLARKGPQNFDGKRALLYARSRHGSARGDFDRTERQRLIIEALQQKVLTANTLANPVKISQLLSAFGDHVSTDMSTTDAGRLATILKKASTSKMASIGLADPPNNFVVNGSHGGQSIVQPKVGLFNYGPIQTYIRSVLKDGFLVKENAPVHVFNGTTKPTAATDQAATLASYGYNIGPTANAPTQDYTGPRLIDVSNGKAPYTRHYLEQRFGVKAAAKLPAGIQANGAQFVIIIGQDETPNRQN